MALKRVGFMYSSLSLTHIYSMSLSTEPWLHVLVSPICTSEPLSTRDKGFARTALAIEMTLQKLHISLRDFCRPYAVPINRGPEPYPPMLRVVVRLMVVPS